MLELMAWDTVLVDGRFRVACVLNTLMIKNCPIIMVHDFWKRPKYKTMLDYTEIIDEADSLVVLRKQKEPPLELITKFEKIVQ